MGRSGSYGRNGRGWERVVGGDMTGGHYCIVVFARGVGNTCSCLS